LSLILYFKKKKTSLDNFTTPPPTFIFYNKINKVMEVYSLCLKKKKKKKKKIYYASSWFNNQIITGDYFKKIFLVRSAILFIKIMLRASTQQGLLFRRYKSV